jgi:hypothetical protein
VKLTDLNPKFWRDPAMADDEEPTLQTTALLTFDCPRCGPEHRVNVPLKPKHSGGWDREGDTLETVTLRPSIQVVDGCRWHGFVTNGEITTC